MLPPFQYHSSGFSEPGISVELYLPKKTVYQGTLYDTLAEGFDLAKVKEHFLATEKRPLINEVLNHHPQWADYTDDYIDRMDACYRGFSLYEVDGVFRSDNDPTIPEEERTQVIRVMFLPDLNSMIEKLNLQAIDLLTIIDFVSDLLRAAKHARSDDRTQKSNREENILIRGENVEKAEANENLRNVSNYIREWYDYVGFFLLGYLVFEICSRIKVLKTEQKIRKPEEVIWLTSFWNLNVNRVIYRPGSSNV